MTALVERKRTEPGVDVISDLILAQEARIVAQAAGHKPDPARSYSAPPVFLFEPHQPEQCDFKPNVIVNIDEVWEQKRKAFEILLGSATRPRINGSYPDRSADHESRDLRPRLDRQAGTGPDD